jgi:hypothetical protein
MARLFKISLHIAIWAAAYAEDTSTDHGTGLPIVDLGYGRYQASLNVCLVAQQPDMSLKPNLKSRQATTTTFPTFAMQSHRLEACGSHFRYHQEGAIQPLILAPSHVSVLKPTPPVVPSMRNTTLTTARLAKQTWLTFKMRPEALITQGTNPKIPEPQRIAYSWMSWYRKTYFIIGH